MSSARRDLGRMLGEGRSGDLGVEKAHDEVLAQMVEVRAQLVPLLDLRANGFSDGRLDLDGYMALGAAITAFKEELRSTYSHVQLAGVLSLAVLDHPNDLELKTLLDPPEEFGRREKPAVFTHVDFQDPRHKILGPNGFAARVVREFQGPGLSAPSVV